MAHWLYEEKGADHIVALKLLHHNIHEIDTFLEKFVMNSQRAIVHTARNDEVPDSTATKGEVVPFYFSGRRKTEEEVSADPK